MQQYLQLQTMGNGLYTQTQKSCFITYVTTTQQGTLLQEKTRKKEFSELRLNDFQDILSEKKQTTKEYKQYATFYLREKDKEANKHVSSHNNNNNNTTIRINQKLMRRVAVLLSVTAVAKNKTHLLTHCSVGQKPGWA